MAAKTSLAMNTFDDYRYLFKIVLLGESGVGKTSVVTKYTDSVFLEQNAATIGVDFRIKTVKALGESVKLQIWDTAGKHASLLLLKAEIYFMMLFLQAKRDLRLLRNTTTARLTLSSRYLM